MTTKKETIKKEFKGIVVSAKLDTTLTVEVENRKPHPKYGKIMKSHKKFLVHNELKDIKLGDEVIIGETKKMSKRKSWKVISLVNNK